MFIRHHCTRFARPFGAFILAVTTALMVLPAPASAQNFFEALFGAPRKPYVPPSGNSYADPQPQTPARHSESGGSGGGVAYCVRLCDGRHFPIQRSSGSSPVQACSSFCPAARTKIFSGSAIDRAVASDGSRYSDLPNAFVYRTRLVSDCTCNGKDSVGLVTATTEDDQTLRAGDIVANENGFVAYTGGKRQNAEFTPVTSYSGLGSELRGRLAGVKIVPNTDTPATIPRPAPEEAKAEAKNRRSAGNRRVQLER